MNNYTVAPFLNQQVGIQWSGITDRTEKNSSSNGVPILIGFFKRGNPTKVVKVTKSTIRAILGYEPKNPHYQQALLMLDQGVTPLSVVTLGQFIDDENSGEEKPDYPEYDNQELLKISCADGLSSAYLFQKEWTHQTKVNLIAMVDGIGKYGTPPIQPVFSSFTLDPMGETVSGDIFRQNAPSLDYQELQTFLNEFGFQINQEKQQLIRSLDKKVNAISITPKVGEITPKAVTDNALDVWQVALRVEITLTSGEFLAPSESGIGVVGMSDENFDTDGKRVRFCLMNTNNDRQ